MPTDQSAHQTAGRSAAGRGTFSLAPFYLLLLSGLLLAPLFLPGHPPLVDYPNHFARMVIALERDETLLTFYDFSWRNMSNIGLEVVVAGLAAVLPVAIAMEIFVGLVLVLTLGGAVALHAALFGRVSVVVGLSAFFVWGGALQFGFLSYCLGVALALWGVAGWIALDGRRTAQMALGLFAAVVLFYVHVLALGAYALLIAGIEIDRILRGPAGSGPIIERFRHALVSGAQFLPPFALLVLSRSGGETEIIFDTLVAKMYFVKRLAWDEGVTLFGLILILTAGVLVMALWRYRMPVDPRLLPGLVLLALAVAVFPAGIIQGGTPNWALNWRYLTPLALAGTAALRDPFEGRQGQVILGVAVSGLLALRIGTMALGSWSAGATQEAALRGCLAELDRGTRLVSLPLPMTRDIFHWPNDAPPVIHMSGFAVVDRSAYIPSLFAYDDQQPLRYRPEWQALRTGLEGMHFPSPETFDWALLTAYDHLLVMARPGDDPAALAADLPLTLGPLTCQKGRFAVFQIKG